MWAGRIARRARSNFCSPARSAATPRGSRVGRGGRLLGGQARARLRRLRGGGAHGVRRARAYDRRRADIGVPQGDNSLRVTSEAPEDKLKEVERLAFAGCPGINTLRA